MPTRCERPTPRSAPTSRRSGSRGWRRDRASPRNRRLPDPAIHDGLLVEPDVLTDAVEEREGEGAAILVRESERKPHVFVLDGRYRDRARDREVTAFHRGQVWVRHSSKNETAGGDDVQRMV